MHSSSNNCAEEIYSGNCVQEIQEIIVGEEISFQTSCDEEHQITIMYEDGVFRTVNVEEYKRLELEDQRVLDFFEDKRIFEFLERVPRSIFSVFVFGLSFLQFSSPSHSVARMSSRKGSQSEIVCVDKQENKSRLDLYKTVDYRVKKTKRLERIGKARKLNEQDQKQPAIEEKNSSAIKSVIKREPLGAVLPSFLPKNKSSKGNELNSFQTLNLYKNRIKTNNVDVTNNFLPLLLLPVFSSWKNLTNNLNNLNKNLTNTLLSLRGGGLVVDEAIKSTFKQIINILLNIGDREEKKAIGKRALLTMQLLGRILTNPGVGIGFTLAVIAVLRNKKHRDRLLERIKNIRNILFSPIKSHPILGAVIVITVLNRKTLLKFIMFWVDASKIWADKFFQASPEARHVHTDEQILAEKSNEADTLKDSLANQKHELELHVKDNLEVVNSNLEVVNSNLEMVNSNDPIQKADNFKGKESRSKSKTDLTTTDLVVFVPSKISKIEDKKKDET